MMLYRTRRIQQAMCGLFLADPYRRWHGFEIMRTAGVNSGGLYVVLGRMRYDDWLVCEWEPGTYPRRRWYQPTPLGVQRMREWLLAQDWLGKRDKHPGLAGETGTPTDAPAQPTQERPLS